MSGSTPSSEISASALKACRATPEAAWERLPELLAALGAEDEATAEQAVECLENAGDAAPASGVQAAPFLIAALAAADRPDDARYWAATLLGRLGAGADGAEQALAASLSADPCLAVRERAAWALGKVGAKSPEAKQALEAASSESHPRLAKLAREALAAAAKDA